MSTFETSYFFLGHANFCFIIHSPVSVPLKYANMGDKLETIFLFNLGIICFIGKSFEKQFSLEDISELAELALNFYGLYIFFLQVHLFCTVLFLATESVYVSKWECLPFSSVSVPEIDALLP